MGFMLSDISLSPMRCKHVEKNVISVGKSNALFISKILKAKYEFSEPKLNT